MNYIDCPQCIDWVAADRIKEICHTCKNSAKVPDPKDVLCNRCAKSTRPLGTYTENYPHGLEGISVIGSYHSYHLFDMTSYTFNLCELCLRQLFVEFKIKPIVEDILGPYNLEGDAAWNEDQTNYEFNVWRDSGLHHQAYLDQKCNVVPHCSNTAMYTHYHDDKFTENCACEIHRNVRAFSFVTVTKFIKDTLKLFL